MKSNPRVSVIMLTYNRERYLPEAISSVLGQTFRDLELIIMDDGSDDNSEALIRSNSDPRIHYFKFEHSGEASRLRNLGLEKSRGEFIAFLDSDDAWLPEKIQLQLAHLTKHPKSRFSFTNVVELNDQGTILRNGIYPAQKFDTFAGNLFNDYVQSKFAIYPSTVLFDKRCLETTGNLNESLPWTDNELFHRLAYHFDALIIHKPLVRIRKHPENTSARLGLIMMQEMIDMLASFKEEKMINAAIFNKMSGHFYYLLGILNLRAGNRLQAGKAFVHCVNHNPWRVKAWIRAFLSFLNIPQKP